MTGWGGWVGFWGGVGGFFEPRMGTDFHGCGAGWRLGRGFCLQDIVILERLWN